MTIYDLYIEGETVLLNINSEYICSQHIYPYIPYGTDKENSLNIIKSFLSWQSIPSFPCLT